MIEEYLSGLWRVGGGSWDVGVKTLSIKGDGNVYLMKLPKGAVLVDCGGVGGLPKVESNVREAGVEPGDVTDLILTHSHLDHSAAANKWQKDFDVRVHLNAIGADWLARGDRRLIGSTGPDSDVEPFAVDHAIADGQAFEVAGAEVLPMFVPGHTPDSMLLMMELAGRRIGFCGDVCFGPDQRGKLGGIGWLCVMWESNLLHYRRSLQQMLETKLDMMLPGHGFILDGADAVHDALVASLNTVEQLLADPLIRHFGMLIDRM